MGIDLLMEGFTGSPYACCANHRQEIVSVTLPDRDIVSRLGVAALGLNRFPELPITSTEDKWAVRWRWEPKDKFLGYCTKREFMDLVDPLLEAEDPDWRLGGCVLFLVEILDERPHI